MSGTGFRTDRAHRSRHRGSITRRFLAQSCGRWTRMPSPTCSSRWRMTGRGRPRPWRRSHCAPAAGADLRSGRARRHRAVTKRLRGTEGASPGRAPLERSHPLDSYQLFERCALRIWLSARLESCVRTAAVCGHRLYWRSGRHSSAVEQLFRKQQVLGSNPSVGSTPRFKLGKTGYPAGGTVFVDAGLSPRAPNWRRPAD